MEASRADRFEEPTGSQLDRLSEVVSDKINDAWMLNMSKTGEDTQRWAFKIPDPQRFNRSDGFEHHPYITVSWVPLSETFETVWLNIMARRSSPEDQMIITDFYELLFKKNTDKIIMARTASIDAIEVYDPVADRIPQELFDAFHRELSSGRCDADELERLITMFEMAEPLIMRPLSNEGENIYNSDDE